MSNLLLDLQLINQLRMETTPTLQITAKEFRNMYFPEVENAHLYELMEGEIVSRSGPTTPHQRVSRKLAVAIDSFVESQKLGEVFYAPIDVLLNDYNFFQPDLVFVVNHQKEIVTPGFIKDSPDLVIEIISSSSVIRDRVQKKKVYQRCGVKEYWLVSLENAEIEVFVLDKNEYQLLRRNCN